MTTLRNLIFDFGNVLFPLDLDATERYLRRCLGDRFEAAREQWLAADAFHRYETGALSTDDFVEILRRAVNPPLPVEEVLSAWNAIFLDMPNVYLELLERLRAHYRVFLLSNINELHAQWIDRYLAEVHNCRDFHERCFDAVYYSYRIGLRKPDQRIYAYVLQDAGLRPEETVFIDDVEDNVRAAESLGIRTILKTPDVDTEHLMRAFLPS